MWWNNIHSGLFLLLSPSHLPRDRALRPSAATVGWTRTIRFTRKLATANPLLLPAATLSGREHGDNSRTWRRVNSRKWRRVNSRTWRRVNHSWEFYLELWYCTAVLFQFHLVSFPDHTPKLMMKGSWPAWAKFTFSLVRKLNSKYMYATFPPHCCNLKRKR